MYDSRNDTLKHQEKVCFLINEIITELNKRGLIHDKSKLCEPEKEIFDKVTPRLKNLTYGSQEYKDSLSDMGIALTHHYQFNQHHPEYWSNGIKDMSLIDLIEMKTDWKAATLRHSDGDIDKSLEINKNRFSIPEFLFQILKNTVKQLNW